MEKSIRLYTSGRKADLKAFDKLRKFTHKWSTYHYLFEVIDVLSDQVAVKQDRIVLTPTIVCRTSPELSKKVIGDISDPEKTALLLGVPLGFHQSRHREKPNHTRRLLQKTCKCPA